MTTLRPKWSYRYLLLTAPRSYRGRSPYPRCTALPHAHELRPARGHTNGVYVTNFRERELLNRPRQPLPRAGLSVELAGVQQLRVPTVVAGESDQGVIACGLLEDLEEFSDESLPWVFPI